MFTKLYIQIMMLWQQIIHTVRKHILGCNNTCTPVYDSVLVRLSELQTSLKEIRSEFLQDKDLLIKELKRRDLIIKAMIEELPDMIWFKDMDGKYVYVNKATREGLLLSNNPIGKTDVELATNARKKYGLENHTLGEMCGDSDQDVKDNKYVNKQYVESGFVKGVMLHLEVNKSLLFMDGVPIGVVGSARNISKYRNELISIDPKYDVFKQNEFLGKG